MNYLRLIGAFFLINLSGEAAYRVNFFFQLVQSLLNLGVALAGLNVVFGYTDSLGGWQQNEILALVGVYMLIGGFVNLVVQPAMQDFIESVREGTLDFMLAKPEDSQVLVSLRRINIWGLIDVGLGLTVVVMALVRLGSRISGVQAVEFVLMLFFGGTIVYSFFVILATLSFWFVRVENFLTIFQSIYEAGRWPVSLYPGWLRYGMTFIVPVAFATTIPAEALTGRLSLGTLLLAVGVALLLLVGARVIWGAGVKHYSGTSA
jgi:ABC-2 type transport system permease protein